MASDRRLSATKPPRTRPAALLLRLRDRDAWNGVTRELLRKMAIQLNMTDTETVHMALANLARDMKLLKTSEVIVGPSARNLKGMDFNGLQQVVARATQEVRKESRKRSAP